MTHKTPSKSEHLGEDVSASKIRHMARQVMGILQEQLDWLKKSDEGEALLSYSESRTKMALVISKGIQTLEDLYCLTSTPMEQIKDIA